MPCAYVVEYLDESNKPFKLKVGQATEFKNRFPGLKKNAIKKHNATTVKECIIIQCDTIVQSVFIEGLLRLHYENHGGILEGKDHFTNVTFDSAPLNEWFFETVNNTIKSKPIKEYQETITIQKEIVQIEQVDIMSSLLDTQYNLAQSVLTLTQLNNQLKEQNKIVQNIYKLPQRKINKINKWLKNNA